MRTFESIILQMQEKKEGLRFSIYELLIVFIEESSWIGTSQQFLELASIWQEISGMRLNTGCAACNLETLKNLKNWYIRESEIVLKNKQQELNKRKNKK
jgi:hypothetical protein